jgi:hypothetical protein
MQFFVPDLADPAKAEWLYASIKAFEVSQGDSVQERRIYDLTYCHNGKPS